MSKEIRLTDSIMVQIYVLNKQCVNYMVAFLGAELGGGAQEKEKKHACLSTCNNIISTFNFIQRTLSLDNKINKHTC